MKNLFLLPFIFIFCGCLAHNNLNKTQNSQKFQTTLPCGDCDGIKHFLSLENGKFKEKLIYITKKYEILQNSGTYIKDGEILRFIDEDGATNFYKIKGSNLVRLNIDLKEVEGIFGTFYIYKKFQKVKKAKYCNDNLCLNLDKNALFFTQTSSYKSTIKDTDFGISGVNFEIYPYDDTKILVISNKKINQNKIKISGFYTKYE